MARVIYDRRRQSATTGSSERAEAIREYKHMLREYKANVFHSEYHEYAHACWLNAQALKESYNL